MCEIAKKLRAENDSLKKELAETELSLMLAESELEAKKTRIAQLERDLGGEWIARRMEHVEASRLED